MSSQKYSILSIILLLAFGLRVYRLGHQNLWGDEAVSARVRSMSLGQVITGKADILPPLYFTSLHISLKLWGSSEFGLRFLSAAAGLLAIPVIYQLGRAVFKPSIGLLAAFVFAISPFQVYYSQEARMYALTTLFTSLSMLSFIRLSRRRNPSSLHWLGYLFSTLAAVYTHYYAFIIVGAEVVALFIAHWRERRALRQWMATLIALVVLYLPFVLIRRGYVERVANPRFEDLIPATLFEIAKSSLIAYSVGTTIRGELALYPACGLIAFATVGFIKSLRNGHKVEFIPLCLIITIIAGWLLNPFVPFFHPRYLMVGMPSFCLLLAQGLMAAKGIGLTLGIALVIAVSSFSLHGYFFDEAYVKGRYGEMMAHVEENSLPGDLLILNNPLQGALFEYYRPEGVAAYYFPKEDILDPQVAGERLAQLTVGRSRIWLVMFGNPAEYDPNHVLERWLGSNGYLAFREGFVDAALSLYVMAPGDIGGIEHPLRANLANKVLLLGYSINATKLAPGDVLLLSLYWQSLTELDESYTVFTHLLDNENRIWAQMDSQPVSGTHPTSEWKAGEVVRDNYGLLIPSDTPSGQYVLEVGMYLWPSMERLPVMDEEGVSVEDDRVVLGKVSVVREN